MDENKLPSHEMGLKSFSLFLLGSKKGFNQKSINLDSYKKKLLFFKGIKEPVGA